MLLVHGTYDKVVHISQSEEMHDALDDLDKPVKMVKIEKVTTICTPLSIVLNYCEIDAFIRQHLPMSD